MNIYIALQNQMSLWYVFNEFSGLQCYIYSSVILGLLYAREVSMTPERVQTEHHTHTRTHKHFHADTKARLMGI